MDFQAGSLGEWTSVTCSAVNKRPSFRRNLDKKLVKELFTESVLPDVNYSNLTLTSSDNFQESLSLDFSIAPKCAFCKIVDVSLEWILNERLASRQEQGLGSWPRSQS